MMSISDAGASTGVSTADVVFTFSYVTWEGAARRGWFMPEDRLAQSLLADRRVDRLLIADTNRRLPVKLARELLARTDAQVDLGDRAHRVQPSRLWQAQPTSLRGVERAMAGYERAVRRAAERAGLENPIVITANPLVAGFTDLSWARSVTFYAVDDWTMSLPYRRWWNAYREAYLRIRERSVRVAAVSPGLRDRLAAPGTGILVSNGLEPSEWSGPVAPPAWFADGDGPLIVYAGTLDTRLDADAVAQTAAAFPHARLALVGPIADRRPLDALRGMPNVEVHPALGRREYAGLLRSADLGVIPHVRSQLTATIEPQKIYEYLAGGLRVVASDLPPLHGIDSRVQLVPEGSDFSSRVADALGQGRAAEEERLTFVSANSWRARHDALIELALG